MRYQLFRKILLHLLYITPLRRTKSTATRVVYGKAISGLQGGLRFWMDELPIIEDNAVGHARQSPHIPLSRVLVPVR